METLHQIQCERSTEFIDLLPHPPWLTDRVSVVIARRSGAAATAVDTLRRRAGSMINEEAIRPCVYAADLFTHVREQAIPKGYGLLCDTVPESPAQN